MPTFAPVEIAKLDPATHMVFGWASVVTKADGSPVVDHQGDIIPESVLEPAAYDFMAEYAQEGMGEMHKGLGHSVVVESVFLNAEKKRAMGMPEGGPVGWWIGAKVSDAAWPKVQDGTYKMFSIQGTAEVQD